MAQKCSVVFWRLASFVFWTGKDKENKKASSSITYKVFTVLKPNFGILQLTGIDKLLYSQIFNMIDKVYDPAIDKAVEVVQIVFPLLFAILVINECYLLCKE